MMTKIMITPNRKQKESDRSFLIGGKWIQESNVAGLRCTTLVGTKPKMYQCNGDIERVIVATERPRIQRNQIRTSTPWASLVLLALMRKLQLRLLC